MTQQSNGPDWLLISHCNTEQVQWFGLSLHGPNAERWFVDLSDSDLDPATDKGITGLFAAEDRIFAAVQSTEGGKVLVLDQQLNPLQSIVLTAAEDLHSIAIEAGILYVTSTRDNSLVSVDLGTGEQQVFWQHESYIHLNDVKFHAGELYVLSQDSPYTEVNTGGTVTRLSDRKTIITGLDQPHSMWFKDNTLTVLSSRVGTMVRVDLDSLAREDVVTLPGYARGIWQAGTTFYAATSAERLHSRKSGRDKVYVDNFASYMGNPEFQSNLYTLDADGKIAATRPLSALNFEVYDLLGLAHKPASERLRDEPESLKSQYYRKLMFERSAPAEQATDPRELIDYSELLPEADSWSDLVKIKLQMSRYRDHKDDFVRGCWYFSDGWPLNFWSNFDAGKARRELQSIKAMGFNTIFIVIPWRGFQPDHRSAAIDKAHLGRAKKLLKLCASIKLRVSARVSYGHAFCNASNGQYDERVRDLLTDPQVLQNWLYYLSALNELNESPAMSDFFLCWEDFWHPISDFQHFTPPQRRDLAMRTGYHQWLAEQVELDQYNAAGFSGEPTFAEWVDVQIPPPESGRQRFFLDFRSYLLRRVFKAALDYISPLSMEYRVDRDRFKDSSGATRFYVNDDYGDVQRPALSYWAPFMNAHNKGEEISADRAIFNLKHMLKCDPHKVPAYAPVINQLNFIDSTPEYLGKHATIAPDAVGEFLQASANVLIKHTSGYAVWALRSYFQNLLYNPGFALKLDGWEASGQVSSKRTAGMPAASLGQGASLTQRLQPVTRGMDWITQATELTLTIDLDRGRQYNLEVCLVGHESQAISGNGASLTLTLALNPDTDDKQDLVLEISNRGEPLSLTRVCLYSYAFDGQILDPWGNSSSYEADIARLNRRLRELRVSAFGKRILLE